MKLWGGRFTKETDAAVNEFSSSISFDKRLYKYDLLGSIAHAKMLGKQGIITEAESACIQAALAEILEELDAGKLDIDPASEDIHSFIEAVLVKKTGDTGKKLHTGRSRNDQVSLDFRMYAMHEILQISDLLKSFMTTLTDIAEIHTKTVMPGYTHMQRAQPVTLAHHLMAYFEMLRRDSDRLADCRRRTDSMPLGSGALASTTLPLDRESVAKELGFSAITENSMDAVSDRDFAAELLSDLSILMMHLSRMSEEIVLWSSSEFGFVIVDDSYSTGSSIMPQKKNPDVAELVRGKTGRVYGHLFALLTTMKGLPLSYNRDMQEDKEPVFEAVDTVKSCIAVFTGMLATLKFNTDAMYKAAQGGFANATDAADYLAKKGLPFRIAHEITGRLVTYCIDKKMTLDEISLDEYKLFSDLFESDIYDAIKLETCVERRSITGGPASGTVKKAIKKARGFLA